MWNFLKRLLIGSPKCKHEWVAIEKTGVYKRITKEPIAYVYIKECKHCGEMKQFRFEADGI